MILSRAICVHTVILTTAYIITRNPSCKTHEGFFLVFGNQFVKLFLLGFHDGFADHSDVVVIDSDRDRDDFVFFWQTLSSRGYF